MESKQLNEYTSQQQMIQTLAESLRQRSSGARVRLVETHISWVLLVGRYAYKIKKAINLGFLDYNTLQSRRFYCEEELRLNRRLAPGLYLGVVGVGGESGTPIFGAVPVIEYAVKMRRFAVSRQFDKLALKHKILDVHVDRLAARLADFHQNLISIEANATYGSAEAIWQDATQNFAQLQVLLTESVDLSRLKILQKASEKEFQSCIHLFEQRRRQGFVRECHGDLHLANIVLIDDQPTPFDAIEFNPALRWIDVMSDVAFTMMDLMYFHQAPLAYRFINAYVAATGDYAGIAVLRFYLVYRAMVRAKVHAIRAHQAALVAVDRAEAIARYREYIALAEKFCMPKRVALIITHGLPGSGKTTFSQYALAQLQAIRIRSDVERKRLSVLRTLNGSTADDAPDLYRAANTQRTYVHLLALARNLLTAGFAVIVDAAFLQKNERDRFRQLAEELSIPFVIASMQASNKAMRTRVTERLSVANDASEADVSVLEKLQGAQQSLTDDELSKTIIFNSEGAAINDTHPGWSKLIENMG